MKLAHDECCNSLFMRCKLVLRFYRQLQSYKEILIWQSIMLRNIKLPGKRLNFVGALGSIRVWLQADAGDAAAGDLVGGERRTVFVGEVEDRESEAMACPS